MPDESPETKDAQTEAALVETAAAPAPAAGAARTGAVGRTLAGKYALGRVLGAGGMGEVYEAVHEATGRRVAVKLVHGRLLARGDEARSRFRREARAAGMLHSPHIVEVLDAGEDEQTGDLYLVMDHLRGSDLQRLVDGTGPLPPDVALRIAAQALAGLVKAHEAGIVHRDIKPANLFLARGDDGEVTVKVLDFGIAKVSEDALHAELTTGLTATNGLLGSPLYMSPEQMQNSKSVDLRTDLWSLGSTLYCALAGRAPYGHVASILALLPAVLEGKAQPLRDAAPWVPPEVAEVVHGALRLAPDDRYPSAAAMLDAVRALLPSGTALRDEMLTGVSPEVRATAASEAATTASPSASLQPSTGRRVVVAGPTAAISGDGPTLAIAEIARPPPTPEQPAARAKEVNRRALLAGSAAAVSLLAIGGWLRSRSRAPAAVKPPEHRRITFRGDASGPSFSPDGKSVAYVAGKKVVVRDLAGGRERDVFAGRAPTRIQWLPGNGVAFGDLDAADDFVHMIARDGAPVRDVETGRVVPTDGGPWREGRAPLTSGLRYAPDGKAAVVFDQSRKELWRFRVEDDVLVLDPRGALLLEGEFSWIDDVVWSPSGRWLLVMTANGPSKYTLWAVRRDTGTLRRVFEESDAVAGAPEATWFQWSSGEDALYYLRPGATGTRDLVRVAFDPTAGEARGDRTVLLSGLDADPGFSLSPDDRRLAYTRSRTRTTLYVASIEGPDAAPVAKVAKLDAGILQKEGFSVSPDGKLVAFGQVENGANVFTVALEGGAPRKVSSLEGATRVTATAWSPDGAEIAFIATLKTGDNGLFRVPSGGGEARAVGRATPGTQAFWSPFPHILYQAPDNRNFNVLDPVSLAESKLLSKESGWFWSPCPAPGGDGVAVLRNPGGGQPEGLWVLSRDDGSFRLLAPDLMPLGYAADGQTLYAARAARQREILRLPAGGGAPTPLVTLPFEQPNVGVVLVPGARRFVVAVDEDDTDVWLVEGFDPEAAGG